MSEINNQHQLFSMFNVNNWRSIRLSFGFSTGTFVMQLAMTFQIKQRLFMLRERYFCRMESQLCWTVISERILRSLTYDGRKTDSCSIPTMFQVFFTGEMGLYTLAKSMKHILEATAVLLTTNLVLKDLVHLFQWYVSVFI